MLVFENISLSLHAYVASQYFQEDVIKLQQCDEKKLKDMLCVLENVDYTYNSKNNIITKLSNHLNYGRSFIHFLEIFIIDQALFAA